MRFLMFAALAVALMTGSAEADSIGAGSASCVTWLAVRHDPTRTDRDGAEQWVLGYVSGVSSVTPLKGLNANAIWAWVDKYCQDHPLDDVSDAVVALIRGYPRTLTEPICRRPIEKSQFLPDRKVTLGGRKGSE